MTSMRTTLNIENGSLAAIRNYADAAIAIAILTAYLATSASATEVMSTTQQNALVQKYCTMCHTDAVKNGGISLEHFDVAIAPPSQIAMMLSKLTGGVALETVKAAASNASAAALVSKNMKSGAMGASGIPRPDVATVDGLIHAFAAASTGATEWTVHRTTPAEASVLTASILREMPLTKSAGEAESYRLVVSCNATTHQGSMQLTWSPIAQTGRLAALVDGKAAVLNETGPAVLMLADRKEDGSAVGLFLPMDSLTIKDPFFGGSVTFPFANLPKDSRHHFVTCFSDGSAALQALR